MEYPFWIAHLIIKIALFVMYTNGCRSVTSIQNYILYNHNYQIISNIDLLKCIITCDTNTNCYSINYLFPMRLCELSNATRAIEPIMFQYRQDAIYIEHLYRPEGSCTGDYPCKNRGTCVNIPQYPGYRCFCTDAYVGNHCQGMWTTFYKIILVVPQFAYISLSHLQICMNSLPHFTYRYQIAAPNFLRCDLSTTFFNM